MPTACPWIARVWAEFRAGNLTRGARDILLTLRTYRGAGGLICPGHQTLAERARCSISSVQRALKQADGLGLVAWAERRVRSGWRWLRTSNRYSLLFPEVPVVAGLQLRRRRNVTTGQPDRGGESQNKKGLLKAMLAEAAQLPDLLAARRSAVEASLLMKGAGP